MLCNCKTANHGTCLLTRVPKEKASLQSFAASIAFALENKNCGLLSSMQSKEKVYVADLMRNLLVEPVNEDLESFLDQRDMVGQGDGGGQLGVATHGLHVPAPQHVAPRESIMES